MPHCRTSFACSSVSVPFSALAASTLGLDPTEGLELSAETLAQDAAPPTSPAPGGSSLLMNFIPILLVIAVFYFVMIGPERKQRRAREQMLNALKKGDRVVTSGGMHGSVTQVQDDLVTLQVDEGVRLKFNRGAIQTVLGEVAPGAAKPAKS